MKTYIGLNNCSRCRGGDPNCYVCQDLPEEKTKIMKRYIYKLTETGNKLLDETMITQRANSRHEADNIVESYAEKLHGKVIFVKSI